jgi:low affinity Fe/Cu permease
MATMAIEYNMDPILPFSLASQIFVNQGITVMIITLIAAIYPVIIINRFNILNAFRR